MLKPHFPRLFRDVLVNALAEIAFPWDAVEAGHFFAEFHALHHPRARGWGRCRRSGLGVVTFLFGHSVLRGSRESNRSEHESNNTATWSGIPVYGPAAGRQRRPKKSPAALARTLKV